MNTKQRTIAVGVFREHTEADRAVAELKKAGFRDDQIGVAGRDWRHEGKTDKANDSLAGEGALAGAVAGAGLGGLVGLGVLAGVIPVIGPAIAAGTLGVILTNAAGGAAIAGLVGALVGLGLPEEDAHFYESEFKSGRYIVTVKADGRYDEAKAILHQYGGYDRVSAANAADASTSQPQQMRVNAGADNKMELREEELHAHKQQVQKGEVRVHKEVITEHRTLDVPVKREEVVVERHAVSGHPTAHSDIRTGEEVRIPVMEEQVNVEKRPVVKEEVTIGKRQVQDTEHVGGTVKKEEVRVEEKGDVKVRGKK